MIRVGLSERNGRACAPKTGLPYPKTDRELPPAAGRPHQANSVATKFQARLEPLQALPGLIPSLFGNLSIARAQISMDQIRSLIDAGKLSQLLFVSVGEFDRSEQPWAAAIGILAAEPGEDQPHVDSANIVHAGPLHTVPVSQQHELARTLGQKVEQVLRERGVNFVQWSTDDAGDSASDAVTAWCQSFGFQRLATLDYLNGKIHRETSGESFSQSVRLEFKSCNWGLRDELASFATLVDLTYQDTRDCPSLSEFRTAIQTLRGYQNSQSFTPSWWFRIHDRATNQCLGCLVMGRQESAKDPAGRDLDIAEIVYMGLVPSARGRGLGKETVQSALRIAQQAGCKHLVLAVDKDNLAAKSIYRQAGLETLLCETVWVKSLVTA